MTSRTAVAGGRLATVLGLNDPNKSTYAVCIGRSVTVPAGQHAREVLV